MGSHDRYAAYEAAMKKARSGRNVARPGFTAPETRPLMRRYEVTGLAPDGTVQHFTRALVAEPHLDEAFAAFARGTLIATDAGPVAIEDLTPGMMLETADAGLQRLMWVGSTVLVPKADPLLADTPLLTRISADSLGLGRPMPDLVLGPWARMLVRHAACRALLNTEEAFAPASCMVDGQSFIGLHAVQPMRVYHLAVDGQHVLLANGVEVESYHPGANAAAMMHGDCHARFLSLFPHVTGLASFGRMRLPRLTAFEMERLKAN